MHQKWYNVIKRKRWENMPSIHWTLWLIDLNVNKYVKHLPQILPVENHHISFDSQTHTKMNYDDWLNANRQFLLQARQIVHRSMPPKFHLCRDKMFNLQWISLSSIWGRAMTSFMLACKGHTIDIPYLILIGCWTGLSQSVYSFTIVAKISFKW